jgi:hypothetical protein
MTLFTRKFMNDAGFELEVDGSYRLLQNSIEDLEYKAWRVEDGNNINAPFVTLSEEEDNRLHEEIVGDESTWEYGDDYE